MSTTQTNCCGGTSGRAPQPRVARINALIVDTFEGAILAMELCHVACGLKPVRCKLKAACTFNFVTLMRIFCLRRALEMRTPTVFKTSPLGSGNIASKVPSLLGNQETKPCLIENSVSNLLCNNKRASNNTRLARNTKSVSTGPFHQISNCIR